MHASIGALDISEDTETHELILVTVGPARMGPEQQAQLRKVLDACETRRQAQHIRRVTEERHRKLWPETGGHFVGEGRTEAIDAGTAGLPVVGEDIAARGGR